MKQIGIVLAAVGILVSGCADDHSSNPGGGGGADPGKVTRADFGDSWPLTVESGTLRCDGSDGVGKAYIVTSEGTFALNGLAKSEYDDIDPIWAEGDDGIPKKDIAPLIDAALELCK